MGEYVQDDFLGQRVVLYYELFAELFGSSLRGVWEREVRRTVRHELRHHLESNRSPKWTTWLARTWSFWSVFTEALFEAGEKVKEIRRNDRFSFGGCYGVACGVLLGVRSLGRGVPSQR